MEFRSILVFGLLSLVLGGFYFVSGFSGEVVSDSLKVTREEMPLKEALKKGFQGEFGAKYPSKVSTYEIKGFSKEICTGPHVKNTRDIGKFKIIKEESSGAGIRRIKAIVK